MSRLGGDPKGTPPRPSKTRQPRPGRGRLAHWYNPETKEWAPRWEHDVLAPKVDPDAP